jgi:SAM-dependent methyltransferase
LARLVGAHGRVVGADIDATKIALAQEEAQAQQLGQIEFRLSDALAGEPEPVFDLVYARFLLTHLPDPLAALRQMVRHIRPGGVVVVEDIDYAGCFCYPDSPAFWRYVELYVETARRRGVDPNIGPRLPVLLLDAGLENVQMQVTQPAGLTGEVKLLNPVTMENIADAVLAEKLASAEEVQQLIDELYAFAHNPRTVASIVRVVQSWGYRISR